ncbi:hypothetical protein CROQUDRAFT_50634 [Cronartium quercuum f. sp. fusiforme G11]|uniref:Sister chromatid cohesion protein Dcc1 n=1 Tax=Cronartium quercuum f. sp. fusiforme G11 TaxID=708437 RepID=A0A9P6T848_9BASI|nr:hypothetical protein CROQUDRAFT_50634 [Cronartium quercuum f. sp. fusiforme G11]
MERSTSLDQTHSLRLVDPHDHLQHFPLPSTSAFLSPTSTSAHPQISYLLLELPPDLLKPIKDHLLQNDHGTALCPMELRGRLDDELVLTTSDKTYSLRTVQNSNSVMVCGTTPELGTGRVSLEVLKTVNETIEIVDVTALPGSRLERVAELLRHSIYRGEEEEKRRAAEGGSAVTFEQLSSETRASDAEIRSELVRLNVVEYASGLRMVSRAYLAEILGGVLGAIIELGFEPHEPLALSGLVELVCVQKNVHPPVLSQILGWYVSGLETPLDLEQSVTLDIGRIVTAVGLSLLLCIRPTKLEPMNPRCTKLVQTVPVESFLISWKARVGNAYGDQYCSIDSLNTHSILSVDQKHLTVVSVDTLSSEPKTRMSQLFEIRGRWRMDELERFVRPLTAGGVKKKWDELMLKYCRKIKEKESVKGEGGKIEVIEVVWLTARNNW